MKKNIILITTTLFLLIANNNEIFGQAKIKAYFNHPVNNTVSTGVNAVYLPSGTMSDTIVAYINRAKYTIDIAQYDYNQSSNDGAYANIATAVNNAYLRGVTIRWIYDGSSSNSGLSALNSGIHTLPRPSNSSGYIMHNKFIIIDASSTNPDDAIVCTGSEDWSSEMFYLDWNNILFIQDSALAYAYTAEFNMMWGSTTAIPNASLAKFGSSKTALGLNTFTIAGHTVELYFSPADNPNSHIASAILTASKDLYVGVYDMTETTDANNIVTAKNGGAYTLAIVDQYTTTPAPTTVNTILSSGLGSNYVVYTSSSAIYHNKMMIVNPSDICDDPKVETGSENWTSSGTNENDENILIIHNDTLANIYLQYFVENFTTIGSGTVTTVPPCTVFATCDTATGISVSSVTSYSATLSWTTVPGAVSYNVQYRPVGTSTWSTAPPAIVNSITITGLILSTTYEFQVQVVCSTSNSAFTASTDFTTSACSPPTGLSETSVTSNSALLNWTAVPGATSYSINYRVTGTTTWSYVTSTINSVTISGLISGTSYQFEVQTYCSATDSSGYSTPNYLTTLTSSTHVPSIENDLKSLYIYPNPTTNDVTISYNTSSAANVSIMIYNIVGQEIMPAENEVQQAGQHKYNMVIPAPGVYFVKLTIGGSTVTNKVVKL